MKLIVSLLVGLGLCAGSAFGQTDSEIRDRIVGTWKLVSAIDIMKDGTTRPYPAYGTHGKGFLMYQRDGYMCADLVNPDRPKWADPVHPTAEEKAALRKQGASAVEMEAAGVAALAAGFGLPFYCVRSVTDLAGESFHLDLNSALRPDGKFATMQLIAASCRRPLSTLPELLRLGRRARTAARTLGEFLADCRF